MCVGYRGVFATSPIGRVGSKPVDRQYLQSVDSRAAAFKMATRRKRKQPAIDERQLLLPWGPM